MLSRVLDDKLVVTRGRGSIGGIETTVLAKAWMCDFACYYRECQVSMKPRVGEREGGCVVVQVMVQADWRTGCWSLPGRTLFHTLGAISGFYSGPVSETSFAV